MALADSVQLATLVRFASSFVEHFALHAQVFGLGHQVVQFFTSLQNTRDSVVQNDLGVVQIILNFGHGVGFFWILELGQVHVQFGIRCLTVNKKKVVNSIASHHINITYYSLTVGHWAMGTVSVNSSRIRMSKV